MTKFEKNQPNVVFVNAGKTAFKMGIHVLDNPYNLNPYKTLWEKGYKHERRKFNENKRREMQSRYENA